MKKYILLPILFFVLSCSSIKVSYDYDKDANFSKYKTYALSEESKNLKIDQLNRNRVLKAVENELASKGFSKSDNPDLIVDVLVKGKEVQTATANSSGYGGYYGYRYGGGFSTTQISYDSYVEGTMLITFIDKSTNNVVWRGTGVKTIDENLSPEDREANINSSVKKIMTNYPPVK